MNRILVLFAHPALENSRLNRAWADAAQDLPAVTFHDLYEEYPEFDIDVSREQALLEEHDRIVLQHPFYWYSTPALVKQWFDLVLEHGWAYGSGGHALRGKALLSAITTGAGLDDYRPGAYHDITLPELLAPIRQTARLCGMHYLDPHVGAGALRMDEEAVRKSAEDYASLLESWSLSSEPTVRGKVSV